MINYIMHKGNRELVNSTDRASHTFRYEFQNYDCGGDLRVLPLSDFERMSSICLSETRRGGGGNLTAETIRLNLKGFWPCLGL